jgi:hypothetical protein
VWSSTHSFRCICKQANHTNPWKFYRIILAPISATDKKVLCVHRTTEPLMYYTLRSQLTPYLLLHLEISLSAPLFFHTLLVLLIKGEIRPLSAPLFFLTLRARHDGRYSYLFSN